MPVIGASSTLSEVSPERAERSSSSQRLPTFTVAATRVAADAWHVTVRELPRTWTVAFARDDIAGRARERIALELGCSVKDVRVRVVETTEP